MPKFRVPVEWVQIGFLYIVADNIDEAIEIAKDPCTDLPEHNDYMDDSFRVIDDFVEEVKE